MQFFQKRMMLSMAGLLIFFVSIAQQKQTVKFVKEEKENKVNVFIGKQLFTSFLYPETLEKPVLYPVYTSNGTMVTRGFPLLPKAGEPEDHPHHLGIWMNFENVNGLDFWNNSYAIPAEKKKLYGWIKTDPNIETVNGKKGKLTYHANWTNQQNEVLLEETTLFIFSGTEQRRVIDRVTTLTAKTEVLLKDAKDGFLGIRLARELQIPSGKEKEFNDDKGIVTVVKASETSMSNGNYLTSEGLQGDATWGTKAAWCKVYGKMGKDSVSVSIIDHPSNINYPTFWHARGYGLFAANPLGTNIFTNGKETTNLQLKNGQSIVFRFRIVVDADKKSTSVEELNRLAKEFASAEL